MIKFQLQGCSRLLLLKLMNWQWHIHQSLFLLSSRKNTHKTRSVKKWFIVLHASIFYSSFTSLLHGYCIMDLFIFLTRKSWFWSSKECWVPDTVACFLGELWDVLRDDTCLEVESTQQLETVKKPNQPNQQPKRQEKNFQNELVSMPLFTDFRNLLCRKFGVSGHRVAPSGSWQESAQTLQPCAEQ